MRPVQLLSAARLTSHGIPLTRLKWRREGPAVVGRTVLYWMQSSQRERYNSALEAAALVANALDLPLTVGLVLLDSYPNAVNRHYRFMIEGWLSLAHRLTARGIGVRVEAGEGIGEVVRLAKNAAVVVIDSGYTRFQEEWRQAVLDQLVCPVLEVEGDVVVPVGTVSPKEEYAARTFRPKIHNHLPAHLIPVKRVRLTHRLEAKKQSNDVLHRFVRRYAGGVSSDACFIGGEAQAALHLKQFLRAGADRYAAGRNDPGAGATSVLSPYLHFGHISPVDIALQVVRHWGSEVAAPFLEQLIVRRELAMNFVYYNEEYDSPGSLPEWAVKTLDRHSQDKREFNYDLEVLSEGRTHDPAWNAAQLQMVHTGHMAGYMRMYWGKKVLEWSEDWRTAYIRLVLLNDRYELDGRDPNGYSGIAWIFGKHDRPWQERPIFGMIRFMNAAGLARKFDIANYTRLVPLP